MQFTLRCRGCSLLHAFGCGSATPAAFWLLHAYLVLGCWITLRFCTHLVRSYVGWLIRSRLYVWLVTFTVYALVAVTFTTLRILPLPVTVGFILLVLYIRAVITGPRILYYTRFTRCSTHVTHCLPVPTFSYLQLVRLPRLPVLWTAHARQFTPRAFAACLPVDRAYAFRLPLTHCSASTTHLWLFYTCHHSYIPVLVDCLYTFLPGCYYHTVTGSGWITYPYSSTCSVTYRFYVHTYLHLRLLRSFAAYACIYAALPLYWFCHWFLRFMPRFAVAVRNARLPV